MAASPRNCTGNLGSFVGPFRVGWIKDATGAFAGVLHTLAATAVVFAVIALVTTHRMGRAQ